MQLDGPGFAPLSGGKAAYLVVLLRGAAPTATTSYFTWQRLAEDFAGSGFYRAQRAVSSDYAPEARQWFSLADRAPEKLLAGLREAGAILDRFFDELLASRQLGDSRLALAGFSQGAATALYAGLRRQTQIPASLLFPEPCRAARGCEATSGANRRFSCSWRGGRCCAFPVDGEREGRLEAAGVPVTAVARPGLGHAIDDGGIALGGDFLRDVLKAPRGDTGMAV